MNETSRLLALALDEQVEPAGDEVSDRILDAALELVAASGVRHLTMDDVAARANVGRMTVYRRFGNRGTLVEALAVRECRLCLARIAEVVDTKQPAEERLARLFVALIREVRTHPLLARLARFEPETFLAQMTAADSTVMAMTREFLLRLIRSAQRRGELVKVDAEVLAELWARLGASFVLMPDNSVVPLDDEQATLAIAREIFGPYVAHDHA